jgi:RNA polymerase sigma-70 factor (ECF subfamily)
MVWRTLRRFGVPDSSLDDAVQDVFVVVHSKLEGFEGRSSLKTWVFGIARRVARNYRPAARSPTVGERLEALSESSVSAHEANVEQLDLARLLERLLGCLHPEKREAFILVEVEQMTILEAAEALGVNPNTVYSRLRSARAEIEQAMSRLRAHTAWRQGCAS